MANLNNNSQKEELFTGIFNGDFAKTLPAMRIMFDVQDMIAGKDNLFTLSIKVAVKQNTPYIRIIDQLKECARDNYTMVAENIGIKLTDEIINF